MSAGDACSLEEAAGRALKRLQRKQLVERIGAGIGVVGAGSVLASMLLAGGSAAATGVVGSLSYDVLKVLIARAANRRISTDTVLTDSGAQLLARYAVCARCAERFGRQPYVKDLDVVSSECGPSGEWTIVVATKDLRARVLIPAGDLKGKTVDVTLHSSA
jgi:hypothetical protein